MKPDEKTFVSNCLISNRILICAFSRLGSIALYSFFINRKWAKKGKVINQRNSLAQKFAAIAFYMCSETIANFSSEAKIKDFKDNFG